MTKIATVPLQPRCPTFSIGHSIFKMQRVLFSDTIMDGDVQACFDAGNTFQQKLNDTLLGLINANNDRKSEIEALRGDHEELKKNHDAFVVTAERENDLRKNEVKSLEERTQKENQAR